MSECSHDEFDTCTGPENDPRIGKLICMDCGTPKDECCDHHYAEVLSGVKCIKCGHFVGNWE